MVIERGVVVDGKNEFKSGDRIGRISSGTHGLSADERPDSTGVIDERSFSPRIVAFS